MSELPEGVPRASLPEPRASASAIVLRRAADGWRVLLGLRSRRSRFMPGHLAFPGGAMDPQDRPDEPGGFARCASREIVEETGLEIAPDRWIDAGLRITPPLFPVRFHTRFFVARLDDAVEDPAPVNPENESLSFAAPAAVLEDWERGAARVPPPVLPILRTLATAADAEPREIARAVVAANELEERAPRIEFSPGLWMLPVRTATLPPATHTNVWIPGGRRFAIVDPGAADENEQARLREVVARRRRAGGEPMGILLTHHHQDHVSGACALARSLSLPIAAHPQTFEQLGSLDAVERTPLHDGEAIDLDGTTLICRLTPGHAPGHLAFELPAEGLLIAGDLVSGLSTILIHPEHGDMALYLESLERMAGLAPRMLLPGHGPPLPAKALAATLEHRRRRERAVLAALDAGSRALDALAREVYAETPEMPLALTRSQTLSHLLKLEREGTAGRADAAGEHWRRPS